MRYFLSVLAVYVAYMFVFGSNEIGAVQNIAQSRNAAIEAALQE